MTASLSVYFANAASTTLPLANQLYTTSGAPSTNATYSTIGNNVTGWIELASQGASAGPVLAAIGAPTGLGFLLDTTLLNNQQIAAGAWASNIRLNASQFPNQTQAGNLTGDIVVRLFKYTVAGRTFSLIVSSTLAAQSLSGTFVTYTLPTQNTASAVIFRAGQFLYLDAWFNCTANANGSPLQGVRLNRLATTLNVGDPASGTSTPGYSAAPLVPTAVSGSRRREER